MNTSRIVECYSCKGDLRLDYGIWIATGTAHIEETIAVSASLSGHIPHEPCFIVGRQTALELASKAADVLLQPIYSSHAYISPRQRSFLRLVRNEN